MCICSTQQYFGLNPACPLLEYVLVQKCSYSIFQNLSKNLAYGMASTIRSFPGQPCLLPRNGLLFVVLLFSTSTGVVVFPYPIIQRYHHGNYTLPPALNKLFHNHFIASAAFLFLCLGSLLFTSIPGNSLCDPPERHFSLSRARTLAYAAHVLII